MKKWKDILIWLEEYFKSKVAATEKERLARQKNEGTPPYTHCLNCGTPLVGMYCHKCGQYASEKTNLFKDVFMEYVNTTYPIDSQILPTVWNLFRRPGFLTTEFVAGKRLSYVHPLKLNLFFLFVVVTALLIFTPKRNLDESVLGYFNREETLTEYVLINLSEDPEYLKLMNASPRDTVLLLCDVGIEKSFPGILESLKAMPSGSDVIPDTSLLVMPSILIEDGILVRNEDNVYSTDSSTSSIVQEYREEFSMVKGVWTWISDLVKKYLPLMVLLTCPLLAWVIRIVNRRRNGSYLNSFVLSLHYTAFLEIFFLLLYLVSVILGIKGSYFLFWLVVIATWLYMTVANHRVFDDVNWIRSGVKGLMINFAYTSIIFVLFTVGLVIALIVYLV